MKAGKPGRPADPARAAARRQGKGHFEGTPCAHGHTLRHVKSGACVACQGNAQKIRRAKALETQANSAMESMFG